LSAVLADFFPQIAGKYQAAFGTRKTGSVFRAAQGRGLQGGQRRGVCNRLIRRVKGRADKASVSD